VVTNEYGALATPKYNESGFARHRRTAAAPLTHNVLGGGSVYDTIVSFTTLVESASCPLDTALTLRHLREASPDAASVLRQLAAGSPQLLLERRMQKPRFLCLFCSRKNSFGEGISSTLTLRSEVLFAIVLQFAVSWKR
jgi:hypothetical protein